jgi:hypothetical protein
MQASISRLITLLGDSDQALSTTISRGLTEESHRSAAIRILLWLRRQHASGSLGTLDLSKSETLANGARDLLEEFPELGEVFGIFGNKLAFGPGVTAAHAKAISEDAFFGYRPPLSVYRRCSVRGVPSEVSAPPGDPDVPSDVSAPPAGTDSGEEEA